MGNIRHTEKEQIGGIFSGMWALKSVLKSSDFSLVDLDDSIPGIIHINRMDDLQLEFLNREGRARWNVDLEYLANGNGLEFLKRVVHPKSIKDTIMRKRGLLQNPDTDISISYIQYLRYDEKSPWRPFLSVSKPLDTKRSITVTCDFPEINAVSGGFNMYSLPDPGLIEKFQSLTPQERKIAGLIASGYTSKEISDKLYLSIHTINTHRKNIRNKLDVKSNVEFFKTCHLLKISGGE